ncbi:MAG: RNA polymerase sigma factor [Elusimicrobiales bacterium]|nr:RNA polymerase sigma factor [Elusimicrobiales bacterium]
MFNAIKKYVQIEEEARDITQEVFLKAYENIEKFREESKISSWLYRIAFNLSINWSERKKGKEIQIDEETIADIPSEEDPYDKIYEKEMLSASLNEILETLPDKYKIVLKLYYFEDKSYEELSAILGIPINTVKIHLLRAKKILKKKFSEKI